MAAIPMKANAAHVIEAASGMATPKKLCEDAALEATPPPSRAPASASVLVSLVVGLKRVYDAIVA